MLIQATIQHFIKIYQLMWPLSTKEFWLRKSVQMPCPPPFFLVLGANGLKNKPEQYFQIHRNPPILVLKLTGFTVYILSEIRTIRT